MRAHKSQGRVEDVALTPPTPHPSPRLPKVFKHRQRPHPSLYLSCMKAPIHFQTLSYDRHCPTSPLDTVMCLIRIQHALFSSCTRHCPTVKSKSLCSHSNWSNQTLLYDSAWELSGAFTALKALYRVCHYEPQKPARDKCPSPDGCHWWGACYANRSRWSLWTENLTLGYDEDWLRPRQTSCDREMILLEDCRRGDCGWTHCYNYCESATSVAVKRSKHLAAQDRRFRRNV